ncbi:hypothetical protein, partial [Mesorhizobium loti]|uniref:hypothetical protein n=1 Tax=Rhizobium loti TaxID=381 RepID=UPI001C022C0F
TRGPTPPDCPDISETTVRELAEPLSGFCEMRKMLALSVEFGLDGEASEAIPDYDRFKSKLQVLQDAFSIQREDALRA